MIELTSAAITRLNFKAEETNETHFRIGVTGGGCTGYEYIFDYCDDIRSDDWTIVVDDIRIVVDAISMPYLEGLTLDFVQKGLNEEFVFNNPNQTQSCGVVKV